MYLVEDHHHTHKRAPCTPSTQKSSKCFTKTNQQRAPTKDSPPNAQV